MDATAWISTLLKIVFVVIIILSFAPLLIWAERRQSAMIQDRIGPHRAGVKLFGKNITLIGLLHPLADALKFMWKEDFIPPKADKLLHSLAPIIALVPSISVFAVIPFGGYLYLDHAFDVLRPGESFSGVPISLQVANINVGMLYVFAIAGTGVVGAAIAGYSSDSKYALLGGVRAAGQMVSYEVTLGLTIVGCFMLYDSLLLQDMIDWQRTPRFFGFSLWGICVQPLAFFMFFTAAIAETKRIPFDVPEGESELAAGYVTEYSGMKFGMFFMGEFVEVITSSAIVSALFLGGYDLPFLEDYGFDFSIGSFSAILPLPHIAVVGLQVLTFVVKLVVMIWLQLMIRWSLPRFRYDQIMQLCWKLLLPLSLVNIMATGAGILIWDSIFPK